MSYLKISTISTDEYAESIAEAFELFDALSVSFADAKDDPVFQVNPDETPFWQHTKISALFAENSDTKKIISSLQHHLTNKELTFETETVADQDWVRITQQQFEPQFYGDTLCICPSYHALENFAGAIVKIDPGLAFGTGTHPTTSMCLQWLSENNPRDKVIIDYGCGSGILALAALALGAKKVIAIDHDPQALLATQNNADLNDFANQDNLQILSSDTAPNLTADIVIANILATPLIELSDLISQLVKNKGHLILSGLLTNETETVFAAYQDNFNLLNQHQQDEWARLDCQKKS